MSQIQRAVVAALALTMIVAGLLIVHFNGEEITSVQETQTTLLPPSPELVQELNQYKSEMGYIGDLQRRGELARVIRARLDGVDTTKLELNLRNFVGSLKNEIAN